MFKQILVGVDEHEGGHDAIALATRLIAADGHVTLAFVETSGPYTYRGVSVMYAAGEREHALGRLRKAREQAGIDAEIAYLRSGSVGRGLHELAERDYADLLVLGSCRRGLVGRVLIGDDTRAALNGATCAVAIAPAGYAAEPKIMREIGVGYDGSPESVHALEFARKLAAEFGAKLSAFEAVALPRYAFSAGLLPTDVAVEELVDEAQQRVAALGDVEPHAAYGHPAVELAMYSASLDLLIVGSRSYGPIGRLVHGSTSQQLAHTARCPLLVLTRAARATHGEDSMHVERERPISHEYDKTREL
jgi:nucleotide-binding universal stress UspA family protein